MHIPREKTKRSKISIGKKAAWPFISVSENKYEKYVLSGHSANNLQALLDPYVFFYNNLKANPHTVSQTLLIS
ncbi:hypothetical protein GBA52_001780 [Prunus armeniaca]|nr:hypothetical protein GBA52_001780 [Prunus armeniaca]